MRTVSFICASSFGPLPDPLERAETGITLLENLKQQSDMIWQEHAAQ
jgi:hypothetical protein